MCQEVVVKISLVEQKSMWEGNLCRQVRGGEKKMKRLI